MTNSKNILVNVTVIKDRKYSKSYNTSIQDSETYIFAIEQNNWLKCFNNCGVLVAKHLTNAKHFKKFSYESTIDVVEYENITEQNLQNYTRAQNLKNEAEKKQNELNKIASEEKKMKFFEAVESHKNTLTSKVSEKINSIRAMISKEQIESRLNGSFVSNEICNKAVGLVGYNYVKYTSWITVLTEILRQY